MICRPRRFFFRAVLLALSSLWLDISAARSASPALTAANAPGVGPKVKPAPKPLLPRVEAPTEVRLGIDVLERSNFLVLRGKRIGLLTHPAGVDSHGVSAIEVLRHAPGVKLVALFATEHGLWNTIGGGINFPDQVDPRTGLMVYSLYTGRTPKGLPTPAQLKVVDLQDVGVRSYTFSGTMKRVMEGCFRQNVEVIVLDRPNPLSGLKVDGPLPDPAIVSSSLVCEFPVPYVHGLTMGELARLAQGTPGVLQIKEEERLHGHLTVVRMVNWRRAMRWPETGLGWVSTSPAINDFASVMGLAMTGLGCPAFTSFRSGVGNQYQFRGISSLAVKSEVVARELRALNLPGLNFRQVSVSNPRTGKAGTGLYVVVTDWDEWRPTELSFYLMKLACKLEARNPFAAATKAQTSLFLHEMSCAAIFRDFAAHGARVDVEAYLRQWREQDLKFQQQSRRFWLYE